MRIWLILFLEGPVYDVFRKDLNINNKEINKEMEITVNNLFVLNE